MTNTTDKAQADSDNQSSSPSANNGDDQHIWRSSKKDDEIQTPPKPSQSAKPIELTADIDELSGEDRENRRRALRSLLDASEARQQGALRARKPTPEAGLRVGVTSGPFKSKEGIILDADYIQSRVLLDMEDGHDAQWVEFARLHSLIVD